MQIAEQSGVIREEATYKFGELVSDIGGALGLICGLSILDLLVFSTSFFRKVTKRITSLVRRTRVKEVGQ